MLHVLWLKTLPLKKPLFLSYTLSLTRKNGGAQLWQRHTIGGTHTKHHTGMKIFKDLLEINQLHLANSAFLSHCNW